MRNQLRREPLGEAAVAVGGSIGYGLTRESGDTASTAGIEYPRLRGARGSGVNETSEEPYRGPSPSADLATRYVSIGAPRLVIMTLQGLVEAFT